MWIKSQGGRRIIKVERIKLDGHSILVGNSGNIEAVASYENKKKAKSEFESIELAIQSGLNFYEISEDSPNENR